MSDRVWTKDEILDLIERNDTMVGRSLVQLWMRQTEDEKSTMSTRECNARGFSGVDAEFLSALAMQFNSKNWLSDKQTAVARRRLHKYAKQLTRIANGEL